MKFVDFRRFDLLNFCLFFFVISLIYYILLPMLNSFSLTGESLFMPWLSQMNISVDSFGQIFTSNTHQWYILSMFHVLTNKYLPEFFDTHPQEMIIYSAKTLLFFIFILFLFSLSKAFTKYSKDKKHNPTIFFMIFIVIFIFFKNLNFLWVFENDCWFYAYILLPIFGLLIYNYVEYKYITNEKFTKRELFSLTGLILCASVSIEFLRFVLLSVFFFGYFFDKICFHYFPNVKIFLKHSILFLTICLLNLITLIHSQGYVKSIFEKISIQEQREFLIESINAFYLYIIKDNFILYLLYILLVGLIIFFIKNKQSKTKILISSFSYLFSIFLYILAISFVKNDISTEHIYFHCGVRFILKVLLLNMILSLIGFFYNYCPISFKKKNIMLSDINFVQFVEIIYNFSSILLKKIYIIVKNNHIIRGYLLKIIVIILILFVVSQLKVFDIKWMEDHLELQRKNTYIIDKINLLNDFKKDKFYVTYEHNKYSGIYFIETYESDVDYGDYDEINIIPLCKDNDSELVCKDKMIKFAKKNFKYKFTKKELEKLDFNSLYDVE